MQKKSKNVFNDSMVLDVHPSLQKPNSVRKTKNFRVITRDANSYIRTTFKGNEFVGSLTAGHVPLAIEERNGVAYIISAFVSGGVIGIGEIGTFPSPNPLNDNIDYVYRPLANYAGDDNSFPLRNGPFRSTEFKFGLSDLVEIELQNEYDESVNVIFTDGKNPIRIVNCGFTVLPGNKYRIENRNAAVDSNSYSLVDFSSTINLIATSKKILNFTFDSCEDGGILGYGLNQYLISYSTEDGNETSILAMSQNVAVFNGNKVSTIKSGKNTGEKTGKLVKFTLSNLDRSYSNVNVYFVHNDGMLSNVRTAYKLVQKFPIVGDKMQIVHTGFENLINISIESLNLQFDVPDTAGTITQSQGYLLAGDIKNKIVDVEKFRKFARHIKIGHKEIQMDIIGPEDLSSRAFSEEINQTNIVPGTEAYNAGYANPKNIYEKTGHWGGESYVYAASIILPDGTSTPLFPCLGIDNVLNDMSVVMNETTSAQIEALSSTGGFNDSNLLNNIGLYRFPNRAQAEKEVFTRTLGLNEPRITVNGVTFGFKNADTLGSIINDLDLGDGKKIKDISIGIQFFRAKRVSDVIVQGLAIDVQAFPNILYDDRGESQTLANYSSGVYTEENSKLIPAYNQTLETSNLYYNLAGSNRPDGGKLLVGALKLSMSAKNRIIEDVLKNSSLKSAFALYSSDQIVDPKSFTEFLQDEVSFEFIYRITHFSTSEQKIHGASIDAYFINNAFYALNDFRALLLDSPKRTGKISFVGDNLDAKNALGFSSTCKSNVFLEPIQYLLYKWAVIRASFNSYLGIKVSGTPFRISQPLVINFDARVKVGEANNQLHSGSMLVNVYRGSAQRTKQQVKAVHQNFDSVGFYPISQKMYWDDTVPNADAENTVASKLDADKKLLLFGGDCYINYTLRKLYNNAQLYDSAVDKTLEGRIGPTIALVHESNNIASVRSAQTIDVEQGELSTPFNYSNQSSFSLGFGPPIYSDQVINKPAALGITNALRAYFKQESNGYNYGYSSQNENLPSVIYPLNVPYVRSRWIARVWSSAKHVASGIQNGYRKFLTNNYQDYNVNFGKIVKLITNNDTVYAVQEKAVGTLMLNERVQTGSNLAGPVYLESTSILPPKMKMLSEEIGSKHKNSIKSTDNAVFGASLDKQVIWNTQGNNSPLNIISDASIDSLLKREFAEWSNQEVSVLNHNIITTWNKSSKEVWMTFMTNEAGSYATGKNFTVLISEAGNKIATFVDFVPYKYFNILNKMYSFNPVALSNRIWQHESPGSIINQYFGSNKGAMISFVVNEDADLEKVFNNIQIISNRVKPSSVVFRVDGAYSEMNLVEIKNQIIQASVEYQKGSWHLSIPKISVVHNKDSEEFNDVSVAGKASFLGLKSRVKGKNMIVEIYYDSTSIVELESVISTFNI